ncbi:immunoglobulin kappa light chain-like [Clinocottus analis]|uniref:immunoglobulin kappa light chain-like n=1 Tax=Clinocottus analis TaxID=304258 RepID=UPI0035BF062B
MTSRRVALYLCLFLGTAAQMTDVDSSINVHQDSGFYSADVGDSLTLRCAFKGIAMIYYWYKQSLGGKPTLMSSLYRHERNGTFYHQFKNNPRFSLDTGDARNDLTISDLHVSDSATYYCAGYYARNFEFVDGATVSVEGSGLKVPALVHQSASEGIQPGGSVTLNCTVHTGTCDGPHSVYWFKDSEESHPGLIYTHGGRNHQCERKPSTQTHTCVYNLPMKSLDLSHAGTYYCAVASCGHILFGDGTTLDFEEEVSFSVLGYFLVAALAFTSILSVFLAYATFTMSRNRQRTDSRSSAASTPNAVHDPDPDNLHYAAVRRHQDRRSPSQRDDTQSVCVYSSVRP